MKFIKIGKKRALRQHIKLPFGLGLRQSYNWNFVFLDSISAPKPSLPVASSAWKSPLRRNEMNISRRLGGLVLPEPPFQSVSIFDWTFQIAKWKFDRRDIHFDPPSFSRPNRPSKYQFEKHVQSQHSLHCWLELSGELIIQKSGLNKSVIWLIIKMNSLLPLCANHVRHWIDVAPEMPRYTQRPSSPKWSRRHSPPSP